MRIALTTVLVGALLLIPTQDAQAGWRSKQCRYQGVDRGHWTKHEVHLTIHCAVSKYPTSHSTADGVASRESGMNYDARNSDSGACGVYQHLPHLWPDRVQGFNHRHPWFDLGTSCYNARSNVLVAISMAHRNGWGPWGE